jgi:DNA-directed RNA polymerase subunit RPC12/RpoP
MLLIFTCESCGKRFKVEERSQGKRGRCANCGHVMRIPRSDVAELAQTSAATAAPEPEPPFRLSPPESFPLVREIVRPRAAEPPAHRPVGPHHSEIDLGPHSAGGPSRHLPDDQSHFELLDDGEEVADVAGVSPAIKRGLQQLAEFEKDPRGYKIDGDRSQVFSFLGVHDLGPASWLYTKWRTGVNLFLRLFRWVDTWAYLISVPFLMLMILGIVVQNRQFVHTGAVAVVLANYGRFWADLISFFVRPYKDGPLHGLLFLFPPYTLYFLVTRWDGMRKIVRRIAMSCIPILGVILIYGFLPLVNPAVDKSQGIGAKLQAGKAELDKQIEGDLKNLENRLIGDGDRAARHELDKPIESDPKGLEKRSIGDAKPTQDSGPPPF